MTQNDAVKTEMRKFIVDNFLFGADDGFKDDESFLEKGFIDSTGVLELVGHIEKEFGVKVADDELTPDNLDSLDQIVAFVERKKAA